MEITKEQSEKSQLLRMGEIVPEEIPYEYLYAVELMAELPTLTDGEFVEFKDLLEGRLREEWWRRFGNPKAYFERAKEKKQVDR